MISRRFKLAIYHSFVRNCPFTRNAFELRSRFLRWAGFDIGKGCRISQGACFFGDGVLKLGDGCAVATGVKLYAEGGLYIGDRVLIKLGTQICARGTVVIGNDKCISEEVLLQSYEHSEIRIGNGGCVAPRTYISATGTAKITIGDDCKIAHMVSIKTNEHVIDPDGPCIGGERRVKDINVKDGCWVCAGAILVPGVTVGRKCVIAAGAVVNRDTPDFALVAGCPAVVKKFYKQP